MTVPVLVQQSDGQFSASLVGSSAFRVVRPSRAEAIAALQHELAAKVAAGELLDLEVEPLGVSGLAGRFRDDAELREVDPREILVLDRQAEMRVVAAADDEIVVLTKREYAPHVRSVGNGQRDLYIVCQCRDSQCVTLPRDYTSSPSLWKLLALP